MSQTEIILSETGLLELDGQSGIGRFYFGGMTGARLHRENAGDGAMSAVERRWQKRLHDRQATS